MWALRRAENTHGRVTRASKGGVPLREPASLPGFGVNFSAVWATCVVPNRMEVAVHNGHFTLPVWPT